MNYKPIDVALACSLLEYRPDVGGSCLVWKVDVGVCGKGKAGTMAGSLTYYGYWIVYINKTHYYAHRLIWAMVHGEDPLCQVDHILGKEAGNNVENLRLAYNNGADNQQNRKHSKNNTSGYRGVGWCKRTKKWRSQIQVNSKCITIGYFDTPEKAYVAYLVAKQKYHPFQPIPRPVDMIGANT